MDPERAVARLIATKIVETVKIAPAPTVCQRARRLRPAVPSTTDPLGLLNSAKSLVGTWNQIVAADRSGTVTELVDHLNFASG